MSSHSAMAAFLSAMPGAQTHPPQDSVLERAVDDDDEPVCRKVCSGPPDRMVCAMQCSPRSLRAKKQNVSEKKFARRLSAMGSVGDGGLHPDERHHFLMQSTLLYLTHLEVAFTWPDMHDYAQVLFCLARYINETGAMSQYGAVMGEDLEKIHLLHACEREVGNRHASTFRECAARRFVEALPHVADSQREASILAHDFTARPRKYRMLLDQQEFMARLKMVPLPVLEAFARAAWYHTEGDSSLERHCVGKRNPFLISHIQMMRGDALMIPTGIDMEARILSLTSTDARIPEDKGCIFEYRVVTAEEQLAEEEAVPEIEIMEEQGAADDANDYVGAVDLEASIMEQARSIAQKIDLEDK